MHFCARLTSRLPHRQSELGPSLSTFSLHQVIYWNETQELLVLVCDEQAFVLKYQKDLVNGCIAEKSVSPESGVPGACIRGVVSVLRHPCTVN